MYCKTTFKAAAKITTSNDCPHLNVCLTLQNIRWTTGSGILLSRKKGSGVLIKIGENRDTIGNDDEMKAQLPQTRNLKRNTV